MFASLVKPESANERISVCYSLSVLALNAVFSTRLRDDLPEWSLISPFDCLYASVRHIVVLLVPPGAGRDISRDDDGDNEHDVNEGNQTSLLMIRPGQIRTHEIAQVDTYPPSVNRLVRALNTTAAAAFLLVMTRPGYPWAKTFALLYLLYWIGPCFLLPAQPVLSGQALKKRCNLITSMGFIFSGHLLIWHLWFHMLETASVTEHCLDLLAHCGTALLATIIVHLMPQTSKDGAGEFLAYLLHVWAFTMSWGCTYFTSLLDWRISLWTILGYDLAIGAFALAKGQQVLDPHRWPAGMLAACLLLVIVIEIQGLGFHFEASPRSRSAVEPS